MRIKLIGALTAAVVIAASSPEVTFSDESATRSDANLITALDVSNSVMRHDEWLEFDGLAKAVVSAAFLDAIAGGRHGRIGFAVFTWSSAGRFEMLVPWTSIASIDDAEQVATILRASGVDRSSWARRGNGSNGPRRDPDLRTNISAAIDFAVEVAMLAPYASARNVINVCGNGRDNVGAGPRAARDRAVATGAAINGLVLGSEEGLADYFREHVQGGVGSFVIEVTQPARLASAMLEKLLRDLIAARQAAPTAVPFT